MGNSFDESAENPHNPLEGHIARMFNLHGPFPLMDVPNNPNILRLDKACDKLYHDQFEIVGVIPGFNLQLEQKISGPNGKPISPNFPAAMILTKERD